MTDRMLAAALAYAERLGWRSSAITVAGKAPAIPKFAADAAISTQQRIWRPSNGSGASTRTRTSAYRAWGAISSGSMLIRVIAVTGRSPRSKAVTGRCRIPSGSSPAAVASTSCSAPHATCSRADRSAPASMSNGAGSSSSAPAFTPIRDANTPGSHHPLHTPLAEPPAWLVDLLAPPIKPSPAGQARPAIEEDVGWGPRPRYARVALQRACEAIELAPVGQQNQTLNREAFGIGRLIGAGLMPRGLAIDCLVYSGTMMRNAIGRRPWHEREIQWKVVRAIRDGELHPREVA